MAANVFKFRIPRYRQYMTLPKYKPLANDFSHMNSRQKTNKTAFAFFYDC